VRPPHPPPPARPPRIVVVALVATLAACSPRPAPPGPPLVVVTIHPVADLVATVAGNAFQVQTLLPPRASVHTWQATPGQIRSLDHAAGFVLVGGGLDGWLDDVGGGFPDVPRLRITEGIELLRAGHGHDAAETTGDPHVWLDPVLVRDAVLPRLTAFLAGLAPGAEAGLEERAAALADSLTALDGQIRALLAHAPRRSFVATHDAWSYFARRYDLSSIGSLYESPGDEPSAKSLASLVDAARAAGVHAVLAEPQMAATAARALAGELGVDVVVVDPLGGPGLEGRERYLDLMRYDARAFARALGAS
jgi:zinc transport system substrate-binding protein